MIYISWVPIDVTNLLMTAQDGDAEYMSANEEGAEVDGDDDSDEEDKWQDPQTWSPEELCRTADGTILFADVNLRADTASDSLLFHQVPRDLLPSIALF